ncbi:hypothetical protein CPB97_005160 [Podila verticillata]|nr:hypothetical protein CPB97_005160 [Podila verticillata]
MKTLYSEMFAEFTDLQIKLQRIDITDFDSAPKLELTWGPEVLYAVKKKVQAVHAVEIRDINKNFTKVGSELVLVIAGRQ